MALFLFLLLAAVVLGFIGAIVKGLLYLLVIGIVVLLVAFAYGAYLFRRGGRAARRAR